MTENQNFPMYKGKPLVRSGDVLYYGSMNDDYVVKLDIKSKKTVGEREIPKNVSIQLVSTSIDISPRKKIVRAGETEGLFAALDMGYVWLNKMLALKPKS